MVVIVKKNLSKNEILTFVQVFIKDRKKLNPCVYNFSAIFIVCLAFMCSFLLPSFSNSTVSSAHGLHLLFGLLLTLVTLAKAVGSTQLAWITLQASSSKTRPLFHENLAIWQSFSKFSFSCRTGIKIIVVNL